ncbi:MAG: SGNH/GDSL hydrolase family protein [Actinomycetota bacterium]|nr:SGNH/GDSL hydrolase family protein [Actinomycetota bacterium]
MAEVQLARTGPRLPNPTSSALDVSVGGSPPGGGLRMVWLGDSTAAGVGASDPDRSLPLQVAAGLGRPVEVVVLARSGARLGDVLDDQLPRVAALDPDVVVVSIGANDVVHLTTKSRFTSRYRRLLDQLRPSVTGPSVTGPSVVVLGIPDMGAPPRFAQPLRAVAGWRGRALDHGIREAVAGRSEVRHVDIAGRTGPGMRRDPDRYFALDRYHPNEAGYGLWAGAVLEVLRSVLLGTG